MIQVTCEVMANEAMGEDMYRMVLPAPAIASAIKPGQFINMRLRNANDPLCRRPFTVARRLSLEGGDLGIEVIYKVVGRGTKVLAGLMPGEVVDIIGPLGHGYEWDRAKTTSVLVAGGVGAATLYTLAEEIVRESVGQRIYVVLGAKTRGAVLMEKEFAALADRLVVATDDGSYGRQGTAVEALADILEREGNRPDWAVYASGPEPMTRALAQLCRERRISAQATLEKPMLCGLGGCLTCVCKVNGKAVREHRDLATTHVQLDPTGEWGYALMCQDGPVFNLDEVVFDD